MLRLRVGKPQRAMIPRALLRVIGLPILAGMISLASAARADSTEAPGQVQVAVRQLEERVARVLAVDGFDAYAALFHPDYSNWGDGGVARDREAFLSGVRRWHAGGGHALSTQLTPLSVEVFGDLALSRYVLREDFNDGNAFVGRFVSLAKREQGRWLLFRTSYTTLYRGPTGKAPDPTLDLQPKGVSGATQAAQ